MYITWLLKQITDIRNYPLLSSNVLDTCRVRPLSLNTARKICRHGHINTKELAGPTILLIHLYRRPVWHISLWHSHTKAPRAPLLPWWWSARSASSIPLLSQGLEVRLILDCMPDRWCIGWTDSPTLTRFLPAAARSGARGMRLAALSSCANLLEGN